MTSPSPWCAHHRGPLVSSAWTCCACLRAWFSLRADSLRPKPPTLATRRWRRTRRRRGSGWWGITTPTRWPGTQSCPPRRGGWRTPWRQHTRGVSSSWCARGRRGWAAALVLLQADCTALSPQADAQALADRETALPPVAWQVRFTRRAGRQRHRRADPFLCTAAVRA